MSEGHGIGYLLFLIPQAGASVPLVTADEHRNSYLHANSDTIDFKFYDFTTARCRISHIYDSISDYRIGDSHYLD